MSVSVTIEGLEKFLAVCEPERYIREVDKAVQHSAVELTKMTQNLPPVNAERTGYEAKGIPVAPRFGGSLRQSIHPQRLGLMAAGVVTGVGYGGYVHSGTSKMPSRPYYKWVLEDFGGLEAIEIILTAAVERATRV